jgi:uncharacterized Fe-S cluster-containing protein
LQHLHHKQQVVVDMVVQELLLEHLPLLVLAAVAVLVVLQEQEVLKELREVVETVFLLDHHIQIQEMVSLVVAGVQDKQDNHSNLLLLVVLVVMVDMVFRHLQHLEILLLHLDQMVVE